MIITLNEAMLRAELYRQLKNANIPCTLEESGFLNNKVFAKADCIIYDNETEKRKFLIECKIEKPTKQSKAINNQILNLRIAFQIPVILLWNEHQIMPLIRIIKNNISITDPWHLNGFDRSK